jgi:hypothetical protein|tara:strand:- start:732 stop:2117 length:1386 start_codon:yes stop_codon:yes gene_type:complete
MPAADAARAADAFFATKRVRALFPVPGVVSVVSQNENGPCPVLALVNALSLSRELDAARLTPDAEEDCGGASMDGIARAVTSVMLERGERAARRDGGVDAETAARSAEDATAAVRACATGMDVNVRFDSCESFEFTREMSMFDVCGLRLMHGWVLGEEEHGVACKEAVGGDGYNRLVERLIDLRTKTSGEDASGGAESVERGVDDQFASTSEDGGAGDREERELVRRAMAVSLREESDAELARAMRDADAIEEFLNVTASQLTKTGLAQMRERIEEREYVVWFRNNHFSVVTKLDGQLYALVTDQGYLHEPDVVWEGLGGDRDGDFFDGSFKPFVPHVDQTSVATEASVATTTTTADSNDALPDSFLRASADVSSSTAPNETEMEKADHAIALQLQAQFEAEDRIRRQAAERRAARADESARAETAAAEPPRASTTSRRKKSHPPIKPKKPSSSSDACVIM